MQTLKVGKKNYKLEYGFEAAYNEECVEKTIELLDMMNISDVESAKKVARLPKIIVDLIHAGLIENHPDEADNAKEIVKRYLTENKNENFMSLVKTISDTMEEDGFLHLIGLQDALETEDTPEDPKNNVVEMNRSEK